MSTGASRPKSYRSDPHLPGCTFRGRLARARTGSWGGGSPPAVHTSLAVPTFRGRLARARTGSWGVAAPRQFTPPWRFLPSEAGWPVRVLAVGAVASPRLRCIVAWHLPARFGAVYGWWWWGERGWAWGGPPILSQTVTDEVHGDRTGEGGRDPSESGTMDVPVLGYAHAGFALPSGSACNVRPGRPQPRPSRPGRPRLSDSPWQLSACTLQY